MPQAHALTSAEQAHIWSFAPTQAPPRSEAVEIVRAILSLPDEQLDYARAKIAFDRVADPTIDDHAVLKELKRLAKKARRLTGSSAGDEPKLQALRKLVYEAGPWNGHRAFAYDHHDYKNPRARLISRYLATRMGNCISMPILFLILADKLGVEMRLAMAPQHIFLRHLGRDGAVTNLEATSGAMPARDAWMRHVRPMSDRAVESGLYMRTLSRRESIALMATSVLEYLNEQRRSQEAIAAADIILSHNPRDANTMVHQSCAFGRIVRAEFMSRYSSKFLIPPHLRPRYMELVGRNHEAMNAAEGLGWQAPPDAVPASRQWGCE